MNCIAGLLIIPLLQLVGVTPARTDALERVPIFTSGQSTTDKPERPQSDALAFSVKRWEGEYFSRDSAGGVETTPCTGAIYSIRGDGTGLRKVVALGKNTDFPTGSPDGRWVYFQSNSSGHSQVYRCRADGTGVVNLTAGDRLGKEVANGPGGFAASSTTTVSVSAGIATFSNLVLDTAGTYAFSESATGSIVGPNSGAFTVNPAAADHMAFTTPPSDTTAGIAIASTVQVSVFDRFDNLLTNNSTLAVTLAVASGPGAFVPGSGTTATVSAGVATFANLVLDTAGAYTLSLSAPGNVFGPNSATFTVNPAANDHLAFSVPPSNTTAGRAINPAMQVQLLDRFGNVETADNTDQVTLSIASGPGSFTPDSVATASVNGGIATFSNLVLDTAGSYAIAERATGGILGPNAAAITVAAADADHLAFGVPPSDTSAGMAIQPAVQVQVIDKYGNVLTNNSTLQVSVSVATGLGGFAATSTTTATISAGIATFANLLLDAAGSGYALAASATGGLTSPTSAKFLLSPAANDHLLLAVPPSDTTAGAVINPAILVQFVDRFGNLETGDSIDQVRLAGANGPGTFTAGSTSRAIVNGGTATFSNIVLDTAGSYALRVSTTGNIPALTSSSFAIATAQADHLAFTVPPRETTAGVAIAPPVQVTLVDRFGNPLTGDSSDQVTIAVAAGPAGFAPSSTTTATVDHGVATFGDLVFDTAGGYTLAATTTDGLTGPNAPGFFVDPTAADHLAFAALPGVVLAGANFGPATHVNILDRFGNLITSDSSDAVNLFLTGSPGTFALGSTTTTPVAGGNAGFSNLVLSRTGTYTLVAAATSALTTATSTLAVVQVPQFKVTLAPVTRGAANAGQAFTVTITAMLNGKTDVAYQGTVQLASSDPQAALAGVSPQPLPTALTFRAADAGTKTITVILNSLGAQAVSVNDALLPSARGTSNSVTVTGVIPLVLDHFIVIGVPATDVAGTAQALIISAVNAGGKVLTAFTGTVQITSNDPSFQPINVNFTPGNRGVVTQRVVLTTPGIESLVVSGSGKTTTLGNIDVVSPATHLRVSVTPAQITAGDTVTLTAQAITASGSPDPLFADTLVVTTTDPHAQVQSQGIIDGVATFLVTLTTAGNPQITITNQTRPSIKGPSVAVQVNSGPVDHLALTGYPQFTLAGSAQSYAVTAFDQFGNRMTTGFTDTVQVLGQTYTFKPGDRGSHTFQAAFSTVGPQTLTVTDSQSGLTASDSNIDVVATAVSLAPDPLAHDQTALIVMAPGQGGTVVITPATTDGNSVRVTVTANGKTTTAGPFSPSALGHLYVVGQAGKNVVQEVAAMINGQRTTIAIPAILIGGTGPNTLSAAGSRANNILIGGPGSDVLTAGTGRDLVIGDAGADTLNAGSGGDILIGGSTAFDANVAALAALLAEWASNNPYAQRVAALFGSAAGAIPMPLNGTAVFNDAAANQVNAASGLDWLWLEPATDKLTGQLGPIVTVKQ